MDAAAQPRAFTQLLDRGLASNVVNACWCPTMDLLALYTANKQLEVHRLNWQRLWWIAPEAPVTALAWRPDGKQLAVGLNSGAVLVLSAEDGATLHTGLVFNDAVTALSWTQAADAEPASSGLKTGLEDRTRRLFEPPLPPTASAAAAAGTRQSYAHRLGRRDMLTWPQRPSRLNVLACASMHGRLALCTDSLFLLISGAVNPGRPSPSRNKYKVTHVHAVAQSSSLRELSVCWATDTGTLRLSRFDVAALGANAAALRVLGDAYTDIQASLTSLRQAAAAAAREFEAGMAAHQGMVDALDQLLRDHGIDSDATADLLLLVTMGEYSAAMEQFLSTTLGEPGLKRVARTVDAALCAVHALVVDRMAPELEMLLFRLGELRGLALAPQGREALHLSVSSIGFAERCAQDCLRLLERLRVQSTAIAAQYRIFFAWLTTALRRFPEDTVDTLMGYPLVHIDAVQEFLHTEFKDGSTVGPLLDASKWGQRACQAISDDEAGPESEPEFEVPPPLKSPAAVARARAENDAIKERGVDLAYTLELLERQLAALEEEEGEGEDGGGGLGLEARRRRERQRVLGEWAGRGLVQMMERLDGRCRAALTRPARKMSPTLSQFPALVLGPLGAWGLLKLQYASLPAATPGSNERQAEAPPEVELAMGCEVADRNGVACIKAAFEVTPPGVVLDVHMFPKDEPPAGIWRVKAGLVLAPAGPGSDDALLSAADGEPAGQAIIDAAFYKDGSLLTLISPEPCQLALVPADALQYREIPPHQLDSRQHEMHEVLGRLAARVGAAPEAVAAASRRRILPHAKAVAPLAVSATRGVGFLSAWAGTQRRGLLLDLEEDEAEEEGEEGEDEGAGAGGEEDMGTP